MKCKKCKSIEATIHVANVGDFCLDCYNDYIAELLGVSKMDDFPKIISGYDADGIMHRFEISNMIMPGFSVWKAEGEAKLPHLVDIYSANALRGAKKAKEFRRNY